MVFVACDKTDPMLAEPEPPSMQLERIYHQPSFGEDE